MTDIELDYPDVLGMITGGPRFSAEVVQCAFGIHPRTFATGQVIEALLLLQNTCDKPVQVSVMPHLPKKDIDGNRLSMITVKDTIQITLPPAETGLVHIPVSALPPTPPSQGNKLGVRLEVRPPKNFQLIRSAAGGRPASILNMSPFRLNILREIGFSVAFEDDHLITGFDILPGIINAPQPAMTFRYETLWSAKELPQERARYEEMSRRAQAFAQTLDHARLLVPLIRATEKRYDEAGLPLHPAEARFVGKLLAYTMEDGLNTEDGFGLDHSAWFFRLTSVIDDKVILNNVETLVEVLYIGALRDAVRLGLKMIERATGDNLGKPDEHVVYADEVVLSLRGDVRIDLSHAYLPLVLAGVMVNDKIRDGRENLWTSLSQLREAWRGRVRLAGSEYDWVARILSDLISDAENTLIALRIPRPEKPPEKKSEKATPDDTNARKPNS